MFDPGARVKSVTPGNLEPLNLTPPYTVVVCFGSHRMGGEIAESDAAHMLLSMSDDACSSVLAQNTLDGDSGGTDDEPTPSKPLQGFRVTLTSKTIPLEDAQYPIIAGYTVRATRCISIGERFLIEGDYIEKSPRTECARHHIIPIQLKKKLDLRVPENCSILRYVQLADSKADANTIQVVLGGRVFVEIIRDVCPGEELFLFWGSARNDLNMMRMGIVWALCTELTPAGVHDRTRKLYTAPSKLKAYYFGARIDVGTGVFAHHRIKAREPIGVYVGDRGKWQNVEREEAITKKEFDETYVFAISEKEFINGADLRTSSILRYVNDALDPKHNNIEFIVGDSIYAVALRDIEPNEELFASYGTHAISNIARNARRNVALPEGVHLYVHENTPQFFCIGSGHEDTS